MSLIKTITELLPITGTQEEKNKQLSTQITQLPSGNATRYHLVLSGGGLRGFAHIGIYRALVEQGYEIASVSGTSMGALVGVFIAAQKKPEEIEEIFTKKSIYKLIDISFSRDGMFSAKRIQQTIKKELGYTNIEDLPLPYTACVTDYTEAKPVYYNTGVIETIVTASCAIPGVFEPIEYEGKLLVDGGVFDNMPVGIQQELPIIGAHVNPRMFDKKNPKKDLPMRALELLIGRDIARQKGNCAIFFEPTELSQLGFGLGEDPHHIIQIGYRHALEVLSQRKKK